MASNPSQDLSYRRGRASVLTAEAAEIVRAMGWLHHLTLMTYTQKDQTDD